MSFSLLVVDDDASVLSSFKRLFSTKGIRLYTANSAEQALSVMDQSRIDTAIVDLLMPGMNGLDLLKKIKERSVMTKVFILTGHGGVTEAVQAMNFGASDFLQKPVTPDIMRAKIYEQIDLWSASCCKQSLENNVKKHFTFADLVGESSVMFELKELILTIGDSDVSVLIQGESGTGKELVAEALHAHSKRRERNLVAVDCASLGDSLMQSELFGHIKGSFTGASTDSKGLIRSADQGSLFLDEIGEMDLALQSRMLRTLQQKNVRPVGSNKTYDIDIRVISATNRKLVDEVAAGRFREDLYYRLNTVLIDMPSLRQRREDIPLLVDYFMSKYRNNGAEPKSINPDTMLCLCSYNWPGNVRELANALARAAVICVGDEITPNMLPVEIYDAVDLSNEKKDQNLGDSLDDYEKMAILNALNKTDNVKRHAAKLLGIGEPTFYRKLRKHGLF